MTQLLDKKQIDEAISRIADMIIAGSGDEIVILGIRDRGEVLSERLAKLITSRSGKTAFSGALDITLYRDDITEPSGAMRAVQPSHIPCPLNGKEIILADDVLHTGRSCRAALDAIVTYGRPRLIKLAVLIDRGGREYPIQADYTGVKLQVRDDQKVRVTFEEYSDSDQAVLE
jgi:pyrimidine operon attenuation protein / uracil phosphoribosyltransferase